jgi:hypothetical protein
MNVEFSNAYQEILLDNLMSIIKQNFMLQTKLKIIENLGKDKEELEKKLNEITELYNSSKSEISQIEIYKSKAEVNNSAHEEKNRIQIALNKEMKKNSELNQEVEELKKQVLILEKLVSETKPKKSKKEEVEPINVVMTESQEKKEYSKIENRLQKILDGSTF